MEENNYAINQCLAAPGLAIFHAGSATVKYGNTFSFKANGRISASITTAAAPALTTATLVAPFPNGTAASPATTIAPQMGRTYSLIGTIAVSGSSSAVATFSWLASPDYSASGDLVNQGYTPQPSHSYDCLIGTVSVLNLNTVANGTAFTPGTTALDATSITATYQDNYAVIGN